MRVSSLLVSDPKVQIGVYSFGSKGPATPKSQFEFDVSKFRDPAGQKQFKGGCGVDPDVRAWVGEDDRVPAIIANCLLLAEDLIRAKPSTTGARTEAPADWLSFSFRDFHGRWASPAVAELVADALSRAGYVVAVKHFGLVDREVK